MSEDGSGRAVLLVGFGGPESLDEVPGFVQSVLGRRPPENVIEAAIGRYAAIGGRSPLPDTIKRQASLLAAELSRRGLDWEVQVGMLHARPTIHQAIDRLAEERATEVAAISLAPYRCEVSTDAYEMAVRGAVAGRAGGIQIRFPADWNLEPGYLGALAETLSDTLAQAPPYSPVIFTAHSLPRRMIEKGDPYADQLGATAGKVAERLGVGEWHLAYQSVSKAAREPWLGPSVEEVIDQLASAGRKSVIVDPIGFLADHLETLYDNDIEHREHAESRGILFHRCPCLNDHSGLIGTLADLAIATIDGG